MSFAQSAGLMLSRLGNKDLAREKEGRLAFLHSCSLLRARRGGSCCCLFRFLPHSCCSTYDGVWLTYLHGFAFSWFQGFHCCCKPRLMRRGVDIRCALR